jgi:type II secretory pathway predicted ATPase ExeA/LysM repeat protein
MRERLEVEPMYTSYFGLNQKPFNLSPDPRFFFLGTTHQPVHGQLLTSISRPGCALALAGRPGTGKTVLIRKILTESDSLSTAIFFQNTTLGVDALLGTLAEELGFANPDKSRLGLFEAIAKELRRKLHTDGQAPLLIVDEAQNLSSEALHTLLLLAHIDPEGPPTLRLILVAQPELAERVAALPAFAHGEWVERWVELDYLGPDETGSYVRHRLATAGARRDDIVTDSAIARLHHYTSGNPRLLNLLCDKALLMAYSMSEQQVSAELVDEVADTDASFRAEDSMAALWTQSGDAAKPPTRPPEASVGPVPKQGASRAAPPAIAIPDPKGTPSPAAESSGPENGAAPPDRGTARARGDGAWARWVRLLHPLLDRLGHAPRRASPRSKAPSNQRRRPEHAPVVRTERRSGAGSAPSGSRRSGVSGGRTGAAASPPGHPPGRRARAVGIVLTLAAIAVVGVASLAALHDPAGRSNPSPAPIPITLEPDETKVAALEGQIDALKSEIADLRAVERGLKAEIATLRGEREAILAQRRRPPPGPAHPDPADSPEVPAPEPDSVAPGPKVVASDPGISNAEPAPGRPQTIEYRIERGDNLTVIARRFGVTVEQLTEWNDLARADVLQVGRRLVIQGPTDRGSTRVAASPKEPALPLAGQERVDYRVRRGDTLYGIAQRFDVTVADLTRWNELANNGHLLAGQRLVIYQPKDEGSLL